MTYGEFLVRIIADGIVAAREDYSRPDQEAKLRGSVEGFEACRGKTPVELLGVLAEARKASHTAFARVNHSEISEQEYWRIRCHEAEVEWVANVVSAMLANQGDPVIVPPTCRGVLKAAEILGKRM
jgi:hypothetical protein